MYGNGDQRRPIYLAIAILILTLCIGIVLLFSHWPFVRGFLGDCLIVILIYCALKTLYDFHPLHLAPAVLLFAFVIEGLQYLRLAHWLGLATNPIARLTIGAVFDPLDLLAYLIGVLLIYWIDLKILMKER